MKNTKIKNVLAVALESNGKSGDPTYMDNAVNGIASIYSVKPIEVPTVKTPALSTVGGASTPTTADLGKFDFDAAMKKSLDNYFDPTRMAGANTKNNVSSSIFSDMMKGNSGNYIGLDGKPWKPILGADGTPSNLDQLDVSASGTSAKNNMGFMDKYGAGITTGLSALNAGVGILAYKDSHRQLKDNLKSAKLNREAVRKDMQYTDEYRNAYKA